MHCKGVCRSICRIVVIAASAPVEMVVVAYCEYSLFSGELCDESTMDRIHLYIIAFDGDYITDEIFAISTARPGYLKPYYVWGSTGCYTVLGYRNSIRHYRRQSSSARAVSALSVALYGMFLAIIIPPARKTN